MNVDPRRILHTHKLQITQLIFCHLCFSIRIELTKGAMWCVCVCGHPVAKCMTNYLRSFTALAPKCMINISSLHCVCSCGTITWYVGYTYLVYVCAISVASALRPTAWDYMLYICVYFQNLSISLRARSANNNWYKTDETTARSVVAFSVHVGCCVVRSAIKIGFREDFVHIRELKFNENMCCCMYI